MELRPETGESIANFKITNQVILLLFPILWFPFHIKSLSEVRPC